MASQPRVARCSEAAAFAPRSTTRPWLATPVLCVMMIAARSVMATPKPITFPVICDDVGDGTFQSSYIDFYHEMPYGAITTIGILVPPLGSPNYYDTVPQLDAVIQQALAEGYEPPLTVKVNICDQTATIPDPTTCYPGTNPCPKLADIVAWIDFLADRYDGDGSQALQRLLSSSPMLSHVSQDHVLPPR